PPPAGPIDRLAPVVPEHAGIARRHERGVLGHHSRRRGGVLRVLAAAQRRDLLLQVRDLGLELVGVTVPSSLLLRQLLLHSRQLVLQIRQLRSVVATATALIGVPAAAQRRDLLLQVRDLGLELVGVTVPSSLLLRQLLRRSRQLVLQIRQLRSVVATAPLDGRADGRRRRVVVLVREDQAVGEGGD